MDFDSDEFEDDLADEDLINVLEGAESHAVQRTAVPARPAVKFTPQSSSRAPTFNMVDLDDLSSDAFSSPEREPVPRAISAAPAGLARTNSGVLRQTTLFGDFSQNESRQPMAVPGQAFTANVRREEPSHHELDREAMQTWVYPTNLGAIRDYQYSIVKNSLFNNTLVALPTGLGKTFIAATVMLNFHRWTKTAKLVFMAPTKPLVAQQVDACYNVAGIPRHETTLLTGEVQPALRVDEWEKRRVFFMTPQTLLNDLSHGYADPKSIALLVIDEAHRATGEYAYAKVAKMIRRFNTSMRTLALTATPGSKIETVQEVIDNLGISHVEIRTEESLDIRQYVHQRNIEQIILDPSDEMNEIFELFASALKPLIEVLKKNGIWYGQNAMAINNFGLMKARQDWFNTRGRHANQGVQGMIRATFAVLTSIAHSVKLLNFHGIKPFYDNLVDLRSEQESQGDKGSKYRRNLIRDPNFQKMMERMAKWLRTDGFVAHPKHPVLTNTVLNHFMDKGHDSGTRVIVFCEFRDSAEDLVRLLNVHRPLIKPTVFVGQADSKRGEGMKQAQQIEIIDKFRQGEFNVLIATSIGEEGLDIGQVDLIVCYDASASPIRMLQRMGRTGRKRAGQIVLLLMRGKEEDQYAKSKDNYEKMQQLVCEGSRFNFRFDLSTRIVPRDIRPEVDKRHVEIPIENTQDQSLPEPKKRRAPTKKKPPKKFHMPDGVETGFQSVKDFLAIGGKKAPAKQKRSVKVDEVAEIPPLKDVALSAPQLDELNRSYRYLPFGGRKVEETDMPDLTLHPHFQRRLTATFTLRHGQRSKRFVKLAREMGKGGEGLVRPCRDADTSDFRKLPVRSFVATDGESEEVESPARATEKRHYRVRSEDEDSGSEAAPAPKRKKPAVRKRAAPAAKPKLVVPIRFEDYECDERDEEEESMVSSLPSPQMIQRKGIQKRKPRRRNGGINSSEIGDECDRESDLQDSDGSDDGSDLVDFIVSDGHVPSQDLDPTSPITSQATPTAPGEKPYFEPTRFSDSDSEGVPDQGLYQTKVDSAFDRSDNEVPRSPRLQRSRRRVVESDSDDEF